MRIPTNRKQVGRREPPAADRQPVKHKGASLSRLPTWAADVPLPLQPKQTINQPGDAYEQEADRIADQVMRMPEPRAQRKCARCAEEVQRQPFDEEDEDLQMKAAAFGSATRTGAPPSVHRALKGPGRPLDAGTRAFMEPRFGADFSHVRVHTDAQAAESARAINARAYTVGTNVVFGAGQYAPATGTGRQLLAHELVHVVQQAVTSDENQTNGYSGKLMRVPTERGIQASPPRYSYSTNCGWIDWSHANPDLMLRLIEQVRLASERLAHTPTTDHELITGPAMESRPGGVLLSGVTPVASIRRALNEEEILSVALRIFMVQSLAFERLQAWTDWIGESSFSQEDLPSNLLGFYRAARGYDRSDIETYCDVWDAVDSLSEFQGHTFQPNRDFIPADLVGSWPAEFSDIQPAEAHGSLMDMVSVTLETLFSPPQRINILNRNLIDDPQLQIEPIGISNPIDISSAVSGPAAAPHFEVRPLRPGHTLQFRWGIRDEQDRAYAMWGEQGQVHSYGSQQRAYIGSGTRALLRERGITSATLRCRLRTGDTERLLTLPVTFTW